MPITPHSVTGFSPHDLMYGRHLWLPLDTLLVQEEGFDNQSKYASVLRARLKDAYEAAATVIQEAGKSTKQWYDSSYLEE